jgi:ABC-2 type transport system permease protein
MKAVLAKEFIQMRRDRLTFAMMIGIPIIQLLLFGYAINTNPHHLRTMVQVRDNSTFSRSFLAAMENSDYFDFVGRVSGEEEARRVLIDGDATFVVIIPENFERDLVRGDRPQILVEADATDPSASSLAVAALPQLARTALNHDLTGPLEGLAQGPPPYEVVVHRLFNPAGETSFNIVPGLLGVILTMTMVIITAVALTREIERGTMETLLSTPVRSLEVMIGKITPYVAVGYIQVVLILIAGRLLFHIPFEGSVILLFLVVSLFIVVNLAIGFLFSTLARNQMQAMQLAFFFMLPSILLSGFMFPFTGMPVWAQVIGEALPATHFMRLVRAIILKGAGPAEIWGFTWPLLVILVVVSGLAMARYRRTLD